MKGSALTRGDAHVDQGVFNENNSRTLSSRQIILLRTISQLNISRFLKGTLETSVPFAGPAASSSSLGHGPFGLLALARPPAGLERCQTLTLELRFFHHTS